MVNAGGKVDIKALVLNKTANKPNIMQLFEYARETKARMLFIRSAVLEKGEGDAFVIEQYLMDYIKELSTIYNIKYKAKQRDIMNARCYSKCYALYLLPIFSADGLIYLCPEHRGNKKLSIGNWITDNWRGKWCDSAHTDIFNNFDISNCPPCRPDPYNTGIQRVLNNHETFEELFF
jgi:sulfatase maturation enzyme AslB (radical SAM superfamily)